MGPIIRVRQVFSQPDVTAAGHVDQVRSFLQPRTKLDRLFEVPAALSVGREMEQKPEMPAGRVADPPGCFAETHAVFRLPPNRRSSLEREDKIREGDSRARGIR